MFIPYEFKAFDVDTYLYKIWNNSIKSRHFLDADNVNEIETILLKCDDYSLYKFINKDKPLHPFIDFDLLVKTLDVITSKL